MMALFVRIRITSGCDFIHNIIASNSMEQEALSASNSMEQEALSANNSMEQEALSASNSMDLRASSFKPMFIRWRSTGPECNYL